MTNTNDIARLADIATSLGDSWHVDMNLPTGIEYAVGEELERRAHVAWYDKVFGD